MPDHKLAAILFADIAGYTAMMQENEQRALELLSRFKEVLEKTTPNHRGQVVHYFGDGCLLTFESSTNSVDCAIALQKAFHENPEVPVRIGLHLGDVVFKDDNVFGDGVNIASRIESLGIPGAILMSKTIRDQIKNKENFRLVSLGSFDFKNVTDSMEVFAIGNPGFAVPKREEMQGKLKNIPRKTNFLKWILVIALAAASAFTVWLFTNKNKEKEPEKISIRSIAVLPFDDMSPGNDQEWFTDGMTDALITELSKISSLNVRSRTSVRQYKGTLKTEPEIASELRVDAVIEGSAVKVGDKVRITAQLINADDRHLWAKDFDGDMKDALILHHEIAQAIARGINIVLSPVDSARFIKPSGSVNPAALEADFKGYHIMVETIEDLNNSISFFQQAIRIDSTFAQAYAHLALAYLNYSFFGEKTPLEAGLLAEVPNKKALLLNPKLTLAHLNQFNFLYYTKWDWQGALEELHKAQELEPNNYESLWILNSYYVCTGKFEKALEICERFHEINPTDQQGYFWLKAFTQFHSSQLDQALQTVEEGLKLLPTDIDLYLVQSWCFTVMERHDDAVRAAEKVITLLMGNTNPYYHGLAGWIYARAGMRKEALAELKILQGSKVRYASPILVGLIYQGLGDQDRAMDFYEEGFRVHAGDLPVMVRSPAWNPIRGNPRFEKLIKDLKFP